MRKFIVILGVFCLVLGARFADNGALNCGFSGEFSAYKKDGSVIYYDKSKPPIFERSGAYATRLDIFGGVGEAMTICKNMNASVMWRETVGDLLVIYAYSPQITKSERVAGVKINVMIAVSRAGGRVSVGVPLLMGSY